jgi:tetratricopeptide (TPR) repeat protein
MTDIATLQQDANTHFDAGRLGEAAAACQQILEQSPERPDVQAFAGLIAMRRGDWAGAVHHYEVAAKLKPDFAEALNNLGRAHHHQGDLPAALLALQQAAEINPNMVAIHQNLGAVQQAAGDLDAAVESYQRVLALDPESAEAHRNIGLARQKQDDAAAAEKSYKTALALRPDWPVPFSNLSLLMLDQRRPDEALKYCEAWMRLAPASIEAMAVMSVARNDSGDEAGMRDLMDFDRLVRVLPEIETPAGYDSLSTFNEALVDHVLAHPTLKVPPEDDPTYHHPKLNITEDLFEGDLGPMADFREVVLGAMDGYRQQVTNQPPHPFLGNWPREWKLICWAVVLDGQGTLAPHVHLDGYLGGVYYPLLPDCVSPDAADQAGWFEIGHPPEDLPHARDLPTRAIPPEEGRMLLFPSYMYHRTLPFQSDTVRISVAFDMKPMD